MANQTEQFIAMIKEEIAESLSSIEYLADKYENKFKNDEITNYVHNANEVFFTREIAGLNKFIAYVDSIDPAGKTPEDIATLIRNVIKQKEKEYEDPEALYEIVNRKLEKTLRYVKLR